MNKTDFKKGDYVVLISSCNGNDAWKGQIPEGYCYKLAQDSHVNHFYIELDTNLSKSNGWGNSEPREDNKKLHLRLATPEEIQDYIDIMRPFKVKVLHPPQILNEYEIY